MAMQCKWKPDQLKKNMQTACNMVQQATQNMTKQASEEIERRGRQDIAGAGHFGTRWQNALTATVTTDNKGLNIQVSMDDDSPPVMYWKIFEYGATITPKTVSMLAIPVGGGPDSDASGWFPNWPRNYSGKLFRKGNALFDASTKEVKYFLTPQAVIPQKFHLRDIVFDVAKSMKQYYTLKLR